MKVPFFNYSKRFEADARRIKDIIYEIATSDKFVLGDNVKAFEGLVKDFTGAKNAIAVANGTEALIIALKAAGVSKDDEVITPAFSFISSARAVSLLGAKPIFIDVSNKDGTIDAEEIRKKSQKRQER